MPKYLNRITSTLAALLVVSSAVLPMAVAKAANTPTPAPANAGQALEIAPPLIYISVNPGQTTTTQVKIRDVSTSPLNVTGQVNDFVASGETGTPKVLLNETSPNPYSLKDWIVPPAALQLVPKQIVTLPVTVHVPANASPGGHYGVIRFTGTAPGVSGNGVSLSASIGALVLMTVSGKITDNLTIKEFSVNHNGKTGTLFQSGPLGFTERISNTGNVHEQPNGLVTIKDMFGRQLATLPVNEPPGNILPASTRKFTETLDRSVIGNKHLFGHYTAKLSLAYAGNKKTVNATMGFWVIPFKAVAIVIVILIAAFFILRYTVKRYNEAVVRRANRK